MKISFNWLKQYIDTDLPAEKVAEILTDTGLEVEHIEPFVSIEGGLEGLVIGEVLSKEQHPDADKLSLTSVNIGEAEPLQIVCGAPNVAAGQRVVVAPVGTTIYPAEGEPLKMKKAKIRGIHSFGMICAEDEIGLGDNHDGIMVLDKNAPVGKKAAEYFTVEHDTIFEIGLTPNRCDAMSHIGVARDLCAALKAVHGQKVQLSYPKRDLPRKESVNNIVVEVKDLKACPRYTSVCINDVKVGPSPAWLQTRLKAIGQRPINNIVDITNFVLHEYGQPLHAFDADKIKGNKVIVQKLKNGTPFTTLDEEKRSLSDQDLMICNADSPMCMAGIFGGLDSGVTESTNHIFLESAYFEPTGIRLSSTAHGLRTDAATHYEKGADPEITIEAIKRAINLICEIADGKLASDINDIYPDPVPSHEIAFRLSKLEELGGVQLEPEAVQDILNSLEIKVNSRNEDKLFLSVPAFKHDVTREVDIVEEVIRIYGLNNIPMPNHLRTNLSFRKDVDPVKIDERIATYLSGAGFLEIMTNSISQSAYYGDEAKNVALLNSMTSELDILRSTLFHGGLEVIAHNLNRGEKDLRLFESAKTYHKTDVYEQRSHLILYFTGQQQGEHWQSKSAPSDFFLAKAQLEQLMAINGMEHDSSEAVQDESLSYALSYALKGQKIGTVGAVKPALLRQFGIKQEVFIAQLDRDFLLKNREKHRITFKAIPKFPSMRRDLSMVLDQKHSFEALQQIAIKEGKHLLQQVNLFDVYRDKKLGDEVKSYAMSFVFRDDKNTLTDKKVDKIMQKLISKYESELGAEVRK